MVLLFWAKARCFKKYIWAKARDDIPHL